MKDKQKSSRLIWITYLLGTLALPIVLLYPALIYSDLAGMGGYDGFASSEMMVEHGAWSSAASAHTLTFYIVAVLSWAWLLSLANLPVATAVVIRHLARRKNPKDR